MKNFHIFYIVKCSFSVNTYELVLLVKWYNSI